MEKKMCLKVRQQCLSVAGSWERQGRRGRGRAQEQLDNVEVGAVESPYSHYRIVPTMQLPNEFMGLEEVLRQAEELRIGIQGLSAADDTAIEEGNPANCSVCRSMRASRVCSPCGHTIFCHGCAEAFVRLTLFLGYNIRWDYCPDTY